MSYFFKNLIRSVLAIIKDVRRAKLSSSSTNPFRPNFLWKSLSNLEYKIDNKIVIFSSSSSDREIFSGNNSLISIILKEDSRSSKPLIFLSHTGDFVLFRCGRGIFFESSFQLGDMKILRGNQFRTYGLMSEDL